MSISLVYEHPNTSIKNYLTSCIRLVASMRIKCHDAAKMSVDLDRLNGLTVDNLAPATWRYYQELLGVNTGTTILVKSLDKRMDIPFTRETLVNHPKTRDGYRVGTTLLRDLLDTYPDKESLIMGNLYPAYSDKYPTTASLVNAPDFTIVAYDTTLVEKYESDLIPMLQEHLYRVAKRWYNKFYVPNNKLYLPGFYSQITQVLIGKLLQLRLDNCKTGKVHSFHLKMYLSNFYELDKYLPYMTRSQAMYFYRNIEYLSRNIGQSQIFHLLKDKLLTERGIPLSELSVRHLDTTDENGLPYLRVRSKPINSVTDAGTEYMTMEDLFKLESKDSEVNAAYHALNGNDTIKDFQYSMSAVTQTKILSSVAYDLTNILERNRDETYLRQWVAWSFRTDDGYGPYYEPNVIVSYTDPRDGVLYEISPKVAFTYMVLLHNRRNGHEFDTVMRIESFDHYVYDCPDLDACMAGVMDTPENIAFAEDLIDRFVEVNVVTSPAQFSVLCDEIFNFDIYAQRKIHSDASPDKKAQFRTILSRFYQKSNYRYSSSSDVTVSSFLATNGLNADLTATDDQFDILITELTKAATGYFENEFTKLANVQKAMVKVFSLLSSYTTKFIASTNENDIVAFNIEVPGIESNVTLSVDVSMESFIGVDDMEPIVHKTTEVIPMALGSIDYDAPKVTEALQLSVDINNGNIGYYDGMIVESTTNSMAPEQLLSSIVVEVEYVGMDQSVLDESGVIGYELFSALSEASKQSLKFPS